MADPNDFTIRRVTDPTEAEAIHDFCVAHFTMDMQTCAESPPYPSLNQLHDYISNTDFVVQVAEDGDGIRALHVVRDDGGILYMIWRVLEGWGPGSENGIHPSGLNIAIQIRENVIAIQGKEPYTIALVNPALIEARGVVDTMMESEE